jgi:hypothetical protein
MTSIASIAVNALTSLGFAEAFGADSRKINNLMLTVDQEVGGSNPPSCTKGIRQPTCSTLGAARLRHKRRLCGHYSEAVKPAHQVAGSLRLHG